MSKCTCEGCLKKTQVALASVRRLQKAGDDFNFDLEEEDAEVAGTLTAVYAHSFTAAGMTEKLTEKPLTPGPASCLPSHVSSCQKYSSLL